MKVELKLTADQVFAIAKLMEQVYESKPILTNEKLMWSIAMDVADKFTKKQHLIYSNQSLFDNKKKHKISLKYHESFALHYAIEALLHSVNDIYNNTILKKVLATLNQKLA